MKKVSTTRFHVIVVARPGFARRAQRTIATSVRPAWDLATGEDLRLPTTTGARLKARDRWMQRYFDLVVRVSTIDVPTRARLLDVMGMIKGPETLLHPSVVAAILRHLLSGSYESSSKPTARPQVSNRGERAVA